MLNQCNKPSLSRRACLNSCWTPILFGALLATAGPASADNVSVVRDLASRVGPIIGSAQACPNVAPPRAQLIVDKFRAVIREASNDDAERGDLGRLFDRYVADGRDLVNTGRTDCTAAERQIADLERTINVAPAPPPARPSSSLADAISPSAANAAVAPTQPLPAPDVHGVTDHEIRFGIVIPYSGSAKENGQNYKQGIDVAFAKVNDAGGVNGRMLKLIPADDGFEPSRTLGAMKQLWDKDQVFGYLGNLGTPTADVSVPFALEHRALFFAPFTGGSVVRHDPPDRYVFNYRPSFMEEADAAVRYLLKIRRLKPNQIAAFGENDAFGDQGFAGVARAFRAMGANDESILRLTYPRNTLDVDEAVNQLRQQKVPIRAVVMTATTRPAAKFIEKTRDLFPGMIYTNMSVAGATALAEELKLLGPRFMENIIVTQAVPAVSGYSSEVLDFKTALGKYFPGVTPDYLSFEGFIAANILIDALRRCGPQIDTERVVDMLENTRNLDLGLGVPISFSRGEHQALHKVWGTELDKDGKFDPIELE
ncbi:ABC transporter substrate-binding protein [Bradyrhizobium sp.]|uniref:ABC transporter substrate-binding protein n=1 Tax=Bradyrhizobium sp. TaxID=376 RepID=UPI003C3DADAC